MRKHLTVLAVSLLLVLTKSAIASDFEGIKTIYLNQEKLKKMNITVFNDRIEAYTSEKIKLIVRTDRIDIISNFKDKPAVGSCCPRFVVNTFKKGSSSYFHRYNDYLKYESKSSAESKNFNGMVCVRVDAVLSDRKAISGNSVYFWYDCTEDLIKLLPTFTKVELMAEILDSSGVNTEEHSYTEMYRPQSGALGEVSVKPNPVYFDTGVIDFSLNEKRNISIAMYDVSGNLRKLFASDLFLEAGRHSINLDLMEYADGMYIIVIKTNNNERLTQRLIKTR
jgi:hypothetical protein